MQGSFHTFFCPELNGVVGVLIPLCAGKFSYTQAGVVNMAGECLNPFVCREVFIPI